MIIVRDRIFLPGMIIFVYSKQCGLISYQINRRNTKRTLQLIFKHVCIWTHKYACNNNKSKHTSLRHRKWWHVSGFPWAKNQLTNHDMETSYLLWILSFSFSLFLAITYNLGTFDLPTFCYRGFTFLSVFPTFLLVRSLCLVSVLLLVMGMCPSISLILSSSF